MLNNLLDGWFHFNVGEGAFYAVFGFIFVFTGILLLIAFFTALGYLMKKVNERKSSKETVKTTEPVAVPAPEIEEGISPEIIAAITAALAVYTEGEQQKCDFVVRRIRKI